MKRASKPDWSLFEDDSNDSVIVLQNIVSDNVKAVGWDPASKKLYVQFKSDSVYCYSEVSEDLFRDMLVEHPWRKQYAKVKSHSVERLV